MCLADFTHFACLRACLFDEFSRCARVLLISHTLHVLADLTRSAIVFPMFTQLVSVYRLVVAVHVCLLALILLLVFVV
jgi:hypothetical protein